MDETKETLQKLEQFSDILLVLDKVKMKIQAVTGIGENGELKTVDPTKKNQNQFMRVDKSGDLFSNFFSNFFSQLKDPTRFSFFKVPSLVAIQKAKEIQQHINHPTEEGKVLIDTFEVKPENTIKPENKIDMETPQPTTENNDYRYQPQQLDWETLSNLGLSKDRLEKLNLLVPLLKGYKTNELVPISLNLGTAITKLDARLSLQPNDQGQIVVAIHGIRKEPQLNFPFFGHEFTKEDKENLLTTGNMGRIVDLTHPKSGETIPSIISVDRLTNELIALKTDYIKIPDEIKGVKLDDHQTQTLLEGKPLYIEGMISKNGEPFSASVQFNADKKYVEFLFDRGNTQHQTQSVEQTQSSDIPRMFRGKELDDEQYARFKVGQTVYIDDLTDKKGQKYQGYITLNEDTGKIDFSFQNPNKLKEQIKPAEAHKTQIAINSEGKTNEATKNIKQPLQSRQQSPKDKKQLEQQKAPIKSGGRKI
ncbi:DUF3945 domain-containing protein [Chryseobacterium sp. OSA05B]|uniref:DUF3945 domain-containing protein n=1 Tax=Chryseobacterium sp. OSA05B TaxID=2862650 RepID=UPI001CBCDEEE|nr:DUF3945 domain-containing protein [Chryseobacterium sp. OSA05B]